MIWAERPTQEYVEGAIEWLAYALVGITVGLIALVMH